MCVIRKCVYRSAVIQVKEFEVQRLSMALDPPLSTPSVIGSSVIFLDSPVCDHRCAEDQGDLMPRVVHSKCFPGGPLCWGKMFIQHRGWNSRTVSRELLQHSSLLPSSEMLSSMRFSLQFSTSPTDQCCCKSADHGMNWERTDHGTDTKWEGKRGRNNVSVKW